MLETTSKCCNSNDQELTLDDLVEIRKQSGPEGEEPETKKITTTVSKLSLESPNVLEVRTALQTSSEHQLQGMRRMLAFSEILKEEKRSLSRHTSSLDLFKSHSDTRASPPAPLDTGDENPHDTPTFQGDVSSLNIHLFVSFHIFVSAA